MKNIVIIPNIGKDPRLSITKKLIEFIKERGARVLIDEKYVDPSVVGAEYYAAFPPEAELIIVVGGDGSMLDASIFAVEYDVPMLGVNLGKVGYLSEVETDRLELLDGLFSGDYKLKEKMLLSVEYHGKERNIACSRFAVNDIVISHDSFFGISHFALSDGNGESIKYRADGLVFATQLGSTAYSLSAGGPILGPNVDAILVTPVCPHSFFNRSVLFSQNAVLTVENIGSSYLNISIDGRFFCRVNPEESAIVRAASKKLRILTFNENSTFATLFGKIKITEDIK